MLREALVLAGMGTVLGLMLGVPLQRALAAALTGVGPLSAWTLVIAPCALLSVTMTACVGPALRAARLDPTTVLRLE